MATDMGGFAQAGGPVFVDRFGRPLSGQINPITGAQRTDFATAIGGETSVVLGANPIPGTIAVFVQGALVNPSSISGLFIGLPSALSAGDKVGVIYRTFDPNPRNASLSAYSAIAAGIYPKIAGWWQLNDTGATFADSHTGNFTLTPYGSPTKNQTAIRGGGGASAKFVASSGASNHWSTSSPLQTNTNAIFCWMKTPGAFNPGSGALGSVIAGDASSTGASPTTRYGIFLLDSTGVPYASWTVSSTNQNVSASTGALSTNTGYFLGYSRDGSAKTVTHYRNATGESPISYTNNASGSVDSDAAMNVGNDEPYSGSYAFLGYLQDVVIFKDQLTSTEVTYLYNSGNGYSYAQLKSNSGN